MGEKLQYSREMKFLGLFLEAVASLGLVVSLSQSGSQVLVKLEEKEVLVDPQSDEGHVQYTTHHTTFCSSIFS